MPTSETIKLTSSQEDYLEAIWALIWSEGVARVGDIADYLNVSAPSVTGALKSLAKRKLVRYSPHKYVRLTDRGMELARKVSVRHGTLQKFLTDILGVKAELADQNACRIEHAVDSTVSHRLGSFVEFLSKNAEAGELVKKFNNLCDRQEQAGSNNSKESRTTLADITPGRKIRIVRMGETASANQRLKVAGLTPGCVVSVVRVAPLGDLIEIEANGRHLTVRRVEAIDVDVEISN